MHPNQQIKTVGHNGQLSLGKAFADKTVLIDQINEHTLMIKTGDFKPHSEAWLTPKEMEKINRSLEWYAKNPPRDNFEEVMAMIKARINEKR